MNLPTTSTTETSQELTENQPINSAMSTEAKTDSPQDKTDLVQKIKTSLFKQERVRFQKVIQQIRQSGNCESLLNNAVTAIQQELQASRVLVYRFDDLQSGTVIAESMSSDWIPTLDETISCNLFGRKQAADYGKKEFTVVGEGTGNPATPYQQKLLDDFQVRSSLALPIFIDRVWGLLVVQQCDRPRQWLEEEINLLERIGAELSIALQPTQPLLKLGQQQNILTKIEQDMQQLMKETLPQIRQSFQADRVLVYGFNPDGSGEVLFESVDSHWKSAATSFDRDCFLTIDNSQPEYVVNDIYDGGFASCLIEAYEALQVKAYIAIPIVSEGQLLGILGIYQNSGTRNWQESEVTQARQYAAQFSSPLQQITFIRHSKFQAKQVENFSDRDFLTSIEQEAQQSMQSLLDKIRASMKTDRAVVFAFNPDWSGKILAESMGAKWKPAGSVLDYDFHFKGGEFEPYYIANNVQTKGLAGAVLEKFEEIEAKAYIIVPIHANNQLMGLLAVYQNSAPRNWQESDIEQLQEYAFRFVKPLQQTSFLRNAQFQSDRMEQAFKREQSLSKVLEKVRLSKDEKAVWQIATDEGRKILDVDRVSIYRFNSDWSGNFVADSAAPGWSDLTKIIPFIEDTFLQNTKGGRYKNGETFTVEDIYLQGHKQCHIELLEQMEARAYALAPIFIADSNMFGSKKLWGLIGCYQNKGARVWQDYEVNTLRQLGLQVGVAMQQINSMTKLEKQAQLEKASNTISERIRQEFNVDDIFKTATQELRRVVESDRAIIYQFNPDWSGQVVAESVGAGWVSLLIEQTNDEVLSGDRTTSDRCLLRKWSTGDITDTDSYLQQEGGRRYLQGQKFTAIDNIYNHKFPACYVESLEKYQAKAYVISPIFKQGKLWGLVGVYQNSDFRSWQESETDLIVKVSNQLGLALQQAELIDSVQKRNQELVTINQRESAVNLISEKIQASLSIDNIFKTTTQELRRVLESDRAIIYQFNPDWSGQVVAESVGAGWVSLLIEQTNDEVLSGDRTTSDRCLLRKWSSGDITNTDTYLQEGGGRKYFQGQKFTAIDNIYNHKFPACYVESLEKYQAKAYVISPIFKQGKLWGLVGVYQNSDFRSWQESETNLIVKVSNQLSLALQQAELIDSIQKRNQELVTISQRESAIIKFSSQLISRLSGLSREGFDEPSLLKSITQELRQVLQVDRVALYHFNPDWSGDFIVESVDPKWGKLVGTEIAKVEDTYFQENKGGRYSKKETLVVNDISKASPQDSYLELSEKFETKAYVIAPIFLENELWGLLRVYQNDAPRHWEDSELAVIEQVGTQVGTILQLGKYVTQLRSQEQQLTEAANQERTKREELQQGALRVLRALQPSFQGDLTVRAPLSEDEIGTIADGYNTTIQSLRELVRQVQISASRVSDTSGSNSHSVDELSARAQQQVQRLEVALEELQSMVATTEEVNLNAQKVEQAVQEANRTVQNGDLLMEQTVDSILEMRDTVSATAKKIKRLGEASQRISKVVNLIDNFATQTNLLSLNAAIEATRAGEFGKGFAVVADEVRTLAYQSANATTEIEKLVEEIQNEISEVTEVMEVGIAQVVQGSDLVDKTRQSLSEIVTVTNQISGLVEGITQATQIQNHQSQSLTEAMNDLSSLANRTFASSTEISQSFQELRDTSEELQTSVSRFKVD